MSNLFDCIKCGQYKDKATKSKKYLCCPSCKALVIAADNADKAEAIEKNRSTNTKLNLKSRHDSLMLRRELRSIHADNDAWMHE